MMVPHGWSKLLPSPANDEWLNEAVRIDKKADKLRARATYDTGTILQLEAYLLRALVERLQARVVIEVGTFIGTSTKAIASGSTVEAVYTCDCSNDCVKATRVIRTFPRINSTVMLQQLAKRGVRADFCFFDGALTQRDVDLLAQTTHERTVFAVHDYTYGAKRRKKQTLYVMVARKGIGNVELLRQAFPRHQLLEPIAGTTLAVLLPEAA
jgi:predicted O-methyltransferase YrrM